MINPFEDHRPRWATLDPDMPVHERDLARRYGKSVRSLQRWRTTKFGPPYMRIGGSIYYRLGDVLAFEAEQRVTAREDR